MTMTLINRTGRMKVYNLPHKTYCAALGKCACTVIPGRNGARVCASLTLASGAEVEVFPMPFSKSLRSQRTSAPARCG